MKVRDRDGNLRDYDTIFNALWCRARTLQQLVGLAAVRARNAVAPGLSAEEAEIVEHAVIQLRTDMEMAEDAIRDHLQRLERQPPNSAEPAELDGGLVDAVHTTAIELMDRAEVLQAAEWKDSEQREREYERFPRLVYERMAALLDLEYETKRGNGGGQP